MNNLQQEQSFTVNPKKNNSSSNSGELCSPCPLCERIRKEEAHFFAQLALHCTKMEKTTDELFAHELCNLHAWKFARGAAPGTCGLIGRDLLGKYLEALQQVEGSGQICQVLSPTTHCLACEYLNELEKKELRIFALNMTASNEDQMGGDDVMFCRFHFPLLLAQMTDGERKGKLLQTQFRATARLAERLTNILQQNSLRPFADENRIPQLAFYGLFGRPYLSNVNQVDMGGEMLS